MKNTKYIEVQEDNRLKQFMLGSLLGDGSIPKNSKGAKEFRMTLGHSEKQLDYLKWKVSFLESYRLATGTITKVVSKSTRYLTGECISFHMKSKSNPYFSKYREIFYKEKKILPSIISELDAFGLSIWYMDDGYITKIPYKNKHRFIYKFSTDSFNKEELDKLIIILKDNFNLNFTINYGKELRLSEKDNDKFRKLIEPHVLDIFNYKLHGKSPE